MLGFFLDAFWGSDKSEFGASRSWHIILVRPNHEKRVHEQLMRRGIESFQPMVEETRQWSDRKKKIDMPLFSGYGFVRISANERLSVLSVRGVRKFVAVDHHPAVVSDEEIRSLQVAVGSSAHLEAIDPPRVGEAVVVQQGPLAGIRGIVTHEGETTQVVISLESLHRAVAVDMELIND
jgi:transcription antitermination factor NusG